MCAIVLVCVNFNAVVRENRLLLLRSPTETGEKLVRVIPKKVKINKITSLTQPKSKRTDVHNKPPLLKSH